MGEERAQTGYPSIDKPWLKYYSEEAINAPLPAGTIYEYLWINNKNHLKETALVYLGRKISYGEMFKNISIVENALLAAGVTVGQIVTISLPSMPEAVYLLYALCKIGAIANMIDPRADAEMLKHYLDEAQSKVFVFLDQCAPIVNSIVDQTMVETAVCVSALESLPIIKAFKRSNIIGQKSILWKNFIAIGHDCCCRENNPVGTGDTSVLMLHTSGTTGLAKGVVLSNSNLNALTHQYAMKLDYQCGQRFLDVIPPFIAFGLCVAVHTPISMGVASILIPQLEADQFVKLLKRYKPQYVATTPPSYESLVNSTKNIDLSFLVLAATGADHISEELEAKVNEYFQLNNSPRKLIKGYGMTEVSSSSCTCWDDCNELGSVGIPLVNMTISVFKIGTTTELSYYQEGELCFYGPNMMQKYYKSPVETAAAMKRHEDGKVWMHSGDIGYITEDGHVYVVDRLKRAITIGGLMVLPSKTERVLLSHPDIDKCAVVGDCQSKLVAHIVLRKSTEKDVIQSEIEKLCTAQLPPSYQPFRYVFCNALPLTPMGKVDYLSLMKNCKSEND